MPELSALQFEEEIRAYLLGRLSRSDTVRALPNGALVDAAPPPVALWWLFEGKRYQGWDGRLCDHWHDLSRSAQALARTYNPRIRLLDVPEGRVDWVQTIARNAGAPTREYVCDASQIGLSPDEASALRGWARWMQLNWARYCAMPHMDCAGIERVPLGRVAGHQLSDALDPAALPIHRWAHVARRSRWPLMRDVVAESLRCFFDPQVYNRLPLPTDHAALFELVCLVRVLKHFVPEPEGIRWIIRDEGNELRVDGLRGCYQHSFGTEKVLRSGAFSPGLADAVARFGVKNVPRTADVVVRFEGPRHGLEGILIEAKSGNQDYGAGLFQAHVYEAALRAEFGGHWVVWVVAENASAGSVDEALLSAIHRQAANLEQGTVWVFSGPADIDRVLGAVTRSPA